MELESMFKDENKDFLTCSICKEIFKHPKQLKCMHTFCQDCLHPLVKKGTPCKIKCPLCREEQEVETFSKIEDNIFLRNLCNTINILQCSFCSEALDKEIASYCIECSDNLCDKCAKAHTLTRVTRSHQVILMSELNIETRLRTARERNAVTSCQQHPNNPLEYFCQTCEVPVCLKLGCNGVDHVLQSGHKLLELEDGPTKENLKKQITEQVKKLEAIIPSFQENICVANDIEKKLIECLEKTKHEIRETAKVLIDEIEAHTESLIEKVDKRAEAIQKIAEHHREAAEIKVMSSNAINQFAKNLCRHGLNTEIRSSIKDLLRRMKELQEDMEGLEETGELRFVRKKEFNLGTVEECKKEYGNILKEYAEKEMAINQQVKRGPNWTTGCDEYDYYGRYTSTIQSIQRNGPNNIQVKVKCPLCVPITCTMNPEQYWLQPSNSYGNYVSRLECYVNNFMKIGDEVKRGLHWPPEYNEYDNGGQNSGNIREINIEKGNATAIVEFGLAPYNAVRCPMYPGCYYVLPLRSYPFLQTWVQF